MGKTILELFRSRNESDGKVAEKKYAPRNSKDIGIQTNSFLINNTAVYAVNFARRTLGRRIGETFLEEDGGVGIGGVGIRSLYTLSTPILHGTDLLRLTTQRTDQTEFMKKSARVGIDIAVRGESDPSVLNRYGIPTDTNPTRVYAWSELEKTQNIAETPSILSNFKNDSTGRILGKALSQPATPGQLVKNAAGAAVSDIKTKARGAIFGEKSTTGFSNASVEQAKATTINYGASDDADPIGAPIIGEYPDGEPKTLFLANNANGRRYSKTFNLQINDSTDNGSNFTNRAYDENVSGFNGLARKYGGGKTTGGGTTPDDILDREVGVIMQPHLSRRLRGIGGSRSYSKLTNNNRNGETKDISKQSLSVRRGMRNGADIINQTGVIDKNVEGIDSTESGTSGLGSYHDFIPLKINRLSDNKTIYFRSTVTGLSETFSPSWDSAKFIGNPFNYYTYSGIDRSVSFNIKVYALNGREMISMWDKLKFLAELTYPAGYTDTSAVIPPFIKFTLGSFYDRKVGFIESLSYTVDENTPWEVGMNTVRTKADMEASGSWFFSNVDNESVEEKLRGPIDKTPLDNYRLPMIVDVQMTVKFVESRINTTNATLYDFGGPDSA